MSFEDDGDMYASVDMSKKNKNYTSRSPIAASYENNDSILMAKSVPHKPPPFESTCNTRSTRAQADSPTNKIKGAIKEFKFKLVVIIIAVVMVAAMVLCLIISFVSIAGNSTLKQKLSDTNIMLQQQHDKI